MSVNKEAIEAAAIAMHELDGDHKWVDASESARESARRYAIAALSTVPIAGEAPEGWTLVPIVPTQRMIDAGKQWTKPSYIYDAMLETAPSAPHRWRPIETAPKDGTAVLVAHDHAVFSAWWSDEDGGWVDGCTNAYEEFTVYANLTHWQPLPAPPEQGNETEVRS